MTATPLHDELTAEFFARELALTDNLAELIDSGVPAFAACQMVFHDGPTLDSPLTVRRGWIEAAVKEQVAAMVARLPWLRWAS